MKMKEILLRKMENYFGRDRKRINHAHQVLENAEDIMQKEPKADRDVVVAAAILHDIGIHAAEKKHGSTAGIFQQIEGPPIAENILKGIGFPEQKIQEVMGIIAHHHTPGKIKTKDFEIVYDADSLVNSIDEIDEEQCVKIADKIDKIFLTKWGRDLARRKIFELNKINVL
jgi:HD superfamily phosphodiesterase